MNYTMDAEQHQKIIDDVTTHVTKHVEETIKAVVNGKIDKQVELIKTFTESFYIASKQQIETNRKLEEKYVQIMNKLDPLVAIYNNVQTFGRVYQWTVKNFINILISLGMVAGAIVGIKELFKK